MIGALLVFLPLLGVVAALHRYLEGGNNATAYTPAKQLTQQEKPIRCSDFTFPITPKALTSADIVRTLRGPQHIPYIMPYQFPEYMETDSGDVNDGASNITRMTPVLPYSLAGMPKPPKKATGRLPEAKSY